MKRKLPTIAIVGIAGVAAYIGYKIFKALDSINISDIEWEKLGEDIYYNYDAADSERNESKK